MAKTIKRWVVLFVEYGDSVDGKARVHGVYPSLKEAVDEMGKAAEGYKVSLGLDEIEHHGKSVSVGSTDECGCEYSIEEIDVPIYDGEVNSVGKIEDNHVHETEITLRQWEFRKYGDLIRSENSKDVIEFIEQNNLSVGDCAASWKTGFDNGYEAEIRVLVDNNGSGLYAVAVVLNGSGDEIAFTDDPGLGYDLDGRWNLYVGDDEYVIDVSVGNGWVY